VGSRKGHKQNHDNKNQIDWLLNLSHTFHQTHGVHDQETTTKASENQGELMPWIRRLKNMTGLHLQKPKSQYEAEKSGTQRNLDVLEARIETLSGEKTLMAGFTPTDSRVGNTP
jgi:hypothetical protein